MAIYARQVSPEFQESPLFLDECFFPDDIILTGNRDYNSHTIPAYDDIIRYFDEMAEHWKEPHFYFTYENGVYIRHTQKAEYTIAEILREWDFCRSDGKPWTIRQRHKWRVLMESENSATDEEIILPALSLLTGHKWETGTIRGSCQSDWQNVIYNADTWNRERLTQFETEYFNEGTEWIIHAEDTAPESPDEISGFSVYCVSWKEEDIFAEIAEAAGGSPEDVILYAYDGETRQPKYRKERLHAYGHITTI